MRDMFHALSLVCFVITGDWCLQRERIVGLAGLRNLSFDETVACNRYWIDAYSV